MPLSDRPWGPTNGAASVANQIPLNQQATNTEQAGGPLPATQVITGTAETQIVSVNNPAVPLTVPVHPDTAIEQAVFDLWWSGYIKTTNTGTITLKVYEGSSATIGSNILIGSSGAINQNSTTAAFWAHARLIFDSVSGVLAGDIEFYVNKQKVASVTLSNFPSGFLNAGNPSANPPTVSNLPVFSFTITSSGAASGTPTTINTQKDSVG
jgi:hypothetical protein